MGVAAACLDYQDQLRNSKKRFSICAGLPVLLRAEKGCVSEPRSFLAMKRAESASALARAAMFPTRLLKAKPTAKSIFSAFRLSAELFLMKLMPNLAPRACG